MAKCVMWVQDDIMMTTSELAKAFGVSSQHIRDLTKQGYLSPVKNYHVKGEKTGYYSLHIAIQEYQLYMLKYRDNPERYACYGSKGISLDFIEGEGREGIKLLSDAEEQ